MTRDDYVKLMQKAVSTPYGLTLELFNECQAEHARGRFYCLRNKLRQSGTSTFDSLSFLVKSDGTLQILRRNQMPYNPLDDGLPVLQRPTTQNELPRRFGYRNFDFAVKGKH